MLLNPIVQFCRRYHRSQNIPKVLAVVVLLAFTVYAYGQQNFANVSYQLVTGNNFVAAKNYYLLTILQEDSAARKLIEKDTLFAKVLHNKISNISQSLAVCKDSINCFTSNIKFSDEEISLVGERFASLYAKDNALGKLVDRHLLPSGAYILFQQLAPREFLQKVWEQDARGVNYAIDVYAAGMKPNYPLIDSIAFNTKARGYSSLVYNTIYTTFAECNQAKLFFVPVLTAALHFLEINERNNAADFEPMVKGENQAALAAIKNIKWNNYKYSLIMIPGAGPEEPTVALSAEGMLRCRLAAIPYKKGLAPFIVTSGGKVHPYKTKYCEATEMKKYLVETLHIPASAIIIDPHARHTTTNMRNTARLIFRYGMPFDKAALTVTTRGQSNMIETTLIARCIKELREAPYKNGVRLSESEMEFYPAIEALQINPWEPMDP